MGYDIHIERPGEWEDADYEAERMHVTLEEWLAAIATVPGVRLIPRGPREIGRGVTVESGPADVELYFADGRSWVFHTFAVDGGRLHIATRARALEEEPVLAFLRLVTAALGAIVRGDEGEEYDLRTGEPAPQTRPR